MCIYIQFISRKGFPLVLLWKGDPHLSIHHISYIDDLNLNLGFPEIRKRKKSFLLPDGGRGKEEEEEEPSLAVGTTGHPVANRNVSLDGHSVYGRMRNPGAAG